MYDGMPQQVLSAHKFTGKERDSESGLDDFGARYYSNRFGRWLSADWSNVPVAVPYANLTNPQTLNLYSMVADDPESFADLDGHCGSGPLGTLRAEPCSNASTQALQGEGAENSGIECSLASCTSSDEVSAQTSQIAAQQQAQAATSVTVLGRKVKIHYASDLTAEQMVAASDKITSAASLLNEHADDLSDAQKQAIGRVHSVDVIGPALHSPGQTA
jgi:RHS repeat-associated protein